MRTLRIKSIGYGLLTLSIALMTATSININYPDKASADVPGVNYLVSQDASGTIANSLSGGDAAPAMSHDGRYVAFSSNATNLVPNDTNGYSDVFVKDTQTGAITRVSLLPSGAQFTNNTYVRDMTYDGRYVLFALMPTGGLLLRDTLNNTTTPVFNGTQCKTYGTSGGAVSADGRYVTYANRSYADVTYQVVIKDMLKDTCRIVSADTSGNIGNADSRPGDISCDGGIISFYTNASNLPGGSGGYTARFDPYGHLDLTKVPSMQSGGSAVSCNGNVLASWSNSSGFANKIDRLTGQVTTLVSQQYSILGTGASLRYVSLSDNGRYAAITTNANLDASYPNTGAYNNYDAYVIDTKDSTSQLLSFTISGNKSGSVDGLVSISADGNKTAYGYKTPSSTDASHALISGLTVQGTRTDVYTSETGF